MILRVLSLRRLAVWSYAYCLPGLFDILACSSNPNFHMQASAERQFKGARPKQETVERAYTFADLSAYPLKKRFLIRAADLGFFVLIKLIGDGTV